MPIQWIDHLPQFSPDAGHPDEPALQESRETAQKLRLHLKNVRLVFNPPISTITSQTIGSMDGDLYLTES
jgi:hypothetical protein